MTGLFFALPFFATYYNLLKYNRIASVKAVKNSGIKDYSSFTIMYVLLFTTYFY